MKAVFVAMVFAMWLMGSGALIRASKGDAEGAIQAFLYALMFAALALFVDDCRHDEMVP